MRKVHDCPREGPTISVEVCQECSVNVFHTEGKRKQKLQVDGIMKRIEIDVVLQIQKNRTVN